jgi:hypothetical protein
MRTVFHAWILAFIAAFASNVAVACMCDRQHGTYMSQVRERFEEGSAVFSAKVVRVTEHTTSDGSEAVADLQVLEVWKGAISRGDIVQVGVAPSNGGIDCQYPTKSGEELLVQLWGSDSPQLVICSLTGRLEERQLERAWLDKLRKQHARHIKPVDNAANKTMEPTR